MALKEEPAPFTGRERRRPENAPARRAFDCAAKSSVFVSTFMSMEQGTGSLAAALGALSYVNDMENSPKGYAREVAGMRSVLQTFGSRPHNQQAVAFLEKAATTIPSLKEPLATEVVKGLDKAVRGVKYFEVAHSAAEKLLEPGAAELPEAIRTMLEAVMSAPDPRKTSSGARAAPIAPPVHSSRDNADPSEQECGTWKKRAFGWFAGGILLLGAATTPVILAPGLLKQDSDPKPGRGQSGALYAAPVKPPQDVSPREPDAKNAPGQDGGPTAPRKITVLNVGPKHRTARRKPAAAFNSYNAAVIAQPPVDPIALVDKTVEDEAERIAALIGSSGPEETEPLFARMGPAAAANPDAGQKPAATGDAGVALCQENVAIAALKRLALGTDDAKAARAIRKLAEFAWYGADKAAAHEALGHLGGNPAVTTSPARLDALLMADQPAPKPQ